MGEAKRRGTFEERKANPKGKDSVHYQHLHNPVYWIVKHKLLPSRGSNAKK